MTREERKQYNYWLRRRVNNKGNIEKQCSKCDQWSEENDDNYYWMNKSKPEIGFSSWCKKCCSKSARGWQVNHWDTMKECFKRTAKRPERKAKEKVRQQKYRDDGYFKDWGELNPGKWKEYSKKHRNHDITESEWRNCLNIFGNTCAYCGLPIEQHIVKRNGKYIIMNFHKEHVDDDGYNDLRNAVPSCRKCNSEKHKDGLDEWYKKQKFFTQERYNKIIWWIARGYKEYIEKSFHIRSSKRKIKTIINFTGIYGLLMKNVI